MSKKKLGFTLIELMVSVTIVLILVGIGSYSINNFIQSKEMYGVRDEVSAQIKLARSLATTNQLPDKTTDLKYVRVSFSGKIITIEAVKNDGEVETGSPYFSKDLELDENVSISILDGVTAVTSFGFLGKSGRLVDINGVTIAGPIIVTVSNVVNSKSFKINDLGIINNNED